MCFNVNFIIFIKSQKFFTLKMCFYYSDEPETQRIDTFLYQQDTANLYPGTLSPLPTQFYNVKQIRQQFIFNKYAYELSVLNSKLNDVNVKENEKEKLKNSILEIQKLMDSEIEYGKKMFENTD